MTTIDFEKFICDTIRIGHNLYEQDEDNESLKKMADLFEVVLESQGLEYKDRQIAEIGTPATEDEIPHKPKFKVGDWVLSPQNITWHIDSFDKKFYQVTDIDGNHSYFKIKDQDKMKPWTIQDAKDGDVLVASDGSIFLFAGADDCSCKYYVALTTCNDVKINKEVEGYWETSRAVHPAIQEQRDLLIQKIKEAGYEWGAVEKVLKKLNIGNTKDTATDAIGELTVEKATILSDGTIIITPEGYTYLLTGNLLYPDNPDVPFSIIRWHKFDYTGCRVANEKETQDYFAELSANGYVWDSENGEMRKTGINNVNNTVECGEPKEELTEFEKQFQAYMYHPNTDPVIMDACCQKLLFLARKQIAEEVDVEVLISKAKNNNDDIVHNTDTEIAYRQGILDVIKEIKRK